jgi:hypothetical protein
MKAPTATKGDSYSAAELAEFRPLVDAALAEAIADLETILLRTLVEPDQPLTEEEWTLLEQRQRKFIAHLETAQARITNGTYGICRVTGKRISKERLLQVPHATLAIPATGPGGVLGKKDNGTN